MASEADQLLDEIVRAAKSPAGISRTLRADLADKAELLGGPTARIFAEAFVDLAREGRVKDDERNRILERFTQSPDNPPSQASAATPTVGTMNVYGGAANVGDHNTAEAHATVGVQAAPSTPKAPALATKKPARWYTTWSVLSLCVGVFVGLALLVYLPSFPYRSAVCLAGALVAFVVALKANPAYWVRGLIVTLVLALIGSATLSFSGDFFADVPWLGIVAAKLQSANPAATYYPSMVVLAGFLLIYEWQRNRSL